MLEKIGSLANFLGVWPIFWEFGQFLGLWPIFWEFDQFWGDCPIFWEFGQKIGTLANILEVWPIFWELDQYFIGVEKCQLEYLISRVGDPSSHSAKDLQGFLYTMESHFKKLSTHSAQKEVLATFLQVALPDGVRLEYHLYLNKDGKEYIPENFMGFLQTKIDAEIRNSQQRKVFFNDKRNPRKGKVMSGVGNTEDKEQNQDFPGVAGTCQVADAGTPCSFCQGKPHPLFRCFRFASASYEKKIQFVKAESRCLRCLRTGHQAKECSQIISGDFCENPFERGHNRLLHKDPDGQVNVVQRKLPAYAHRAQRQLSDSRLIAAASLILHLRCPELGKEVTVNALLDTGTTDFIIDTCRPAGP